MRIYEDDDGSRKEEIAALKGDNPFRWVHAPNAATSHHDVIYVVIHQTLMQVILKDPSSAVPFTSG